MADHVIGIVEEVINNGTGKGSGLRIDGRKYGVYNPSESGLDDIEVGDNVSLRYAEKPGGGGITYKNVRGKITKVKGDIAPVGPTDTTGSVTVSKGRKNFTFPVPIDDGARAIVRQNALTNAVSTVKAVFSTHTDITDLEAATWEDTKNQATAVAELVVELARVYEDYTSGDGDFAAAKAKLTSDE